MKRPRAGIRSTRKLVKPKLVSPIEEQHIPINKSQDTLMAEEMNSVPNLITDDYESCDGANNLFCYAALADAVRKTLYTDATGALPASWLDGHQYYFTAYDYDTNYIFAIPMRDLIDKSVIPSFNDVFTQMKAKGFKPEFNMDNQAARSIKQYVETQECDFQFVEPSNHQVNADERAIQTYKNHFISGLCSTNENWPIQLWDQITTQAMITLNLLRISGIDPTKSAYHHFHGHQFDWNRHPLAPPGTKAIIYEDPGTRTSWGPQGQMHGTVALH